VSVVADTAALQERIRLAPGALIGARIKRARKDAGLSHDRLGDLLDGVTRQHLIKLEKALHRPRAEMLQRIADATGKPLEWFFDEGARPQPDDFAQLGQSLAEVLRREVRAVINQELQREENAA
jgi:transcriptional regulator with XRE-family HTH domain